MTEYTRRIPEIDAETRQLIKRDIFNAKKAIFDAIKPGREGWVYLIHAQGTNRYKIGRSVNPVSRHQMLQGQSPYPLKIVKTLWTIDTVIDEANMHNEASDYRAHGEWFELEHGEPCYSYGVVETLFEFGYVMDAVAYMSLIHLIEKIGWSKEANNELFYHLNDKVSFLYWNLNSKAEFTSIECFIRQKLPEFIISQTEDMNKEQAFTEIKSLLIGAINGFALAHGKNL